ncbi:MAG: hypothetical protein IAG13_06855 [Deltaproteobacteria bacterium]|nr:hypothetical protein [Nannocystaceae bacterium]
MAGRSLGSILAASLLLLVTPGCDEPEPADQQLREGIDVLPFIPVCTACMMWSFGGVQWALHRAQPGLAELDSELEVPEAVEATGPIELVAARRTATSPWRFAVDADSYLLGDLRIYVWSTHAPNEDADADDASSSGPDEDEDLDAPVEGGSDKPKRPAQLWILRNGGEGWCDAPSLGGAPLPGEKDLDELIEQLDIERQPCTDVM